jgi:hypothetical protein
MTLRRERERKQFEMNLYQACHALIHYAKRGELHKWREDVASGEDETVGGYWIDSIRYWANQLNTAVQTGDEEIAP